MSPKHANTMPFWSTLKFYYNAMLVSKHSNRPYFPSQGDVTPAKENSVTFSTTNQIISQQQETDQSRLVVEAQ